MAVIIDGRKIAEQIINNLKIEYEKMKIENKIAMLAVIAVGDNAASKIYIKNKKKAFDKIEIKCKEFLLNANTTQDELLNLIDKLNDDKNITGILLQSPIPKHLNINEAFERISQYKDVDGFNPINIGRLVIGQDTFVPCTAYGIMRIFDEYKIDITGKDVVILGRSNIVGKPLAICCLKKNATVMICHTKTKKLEEKLKNADVIISAIGCPNFITANMVKDGVVIIDVGINRLKNGKIVGDVDFENVKNKASYITPVPGGVGPMTVAMLAHNVIKATNIKIIKM